MMLVGMMVVGASAASFPDSDKIEHTEAVDNMVALGIILGKDNGNFDPEGNVTRAEMAKMICVAMNGGKDPKLTGSAAYGDTTNHWAAGYIQWCTNFGYVSGYNGLFRPDDTVTGTEAAKMLLVALGYNAQKEKYENDAAWATNINVAANLKGLYDELAISPDATLNRDAAAQMVWNACNATMVKYEFQGFVVDGTSITQAVDKTMPNSTALATILKEKFKLSDKVGYLTAISYDEDTKEYTYTFDNGTTFGIASAKQIDSADLSAELTTTKDFTELYGQRVNTLYKVVNGETTVYGMYTDSDKAIETTKAAVEIPTDTTKLTFKADGTEYKLNNAVEDTPVYVAPNGDKFHTTNTNLDDVMNDATTLPCASLTFVGDTKIDYAILVPAKVAKVAYVGKDSITISGVDTAKFDDDNIADGIKKGDFVKFVAAANSFTNQKTVTKLDVISGTADAVRSGEVKVNGSWYKYSGVEALTLGEDYDLSIIGKYIYNAEQTSEGAKLDDLVLAVDPQAVKFGTSQTKLYFTDGSSKIVEVSEVDGTAATAPTDNTLYSYTTKNGEYKLTTVDTDNKLGTDGYDANVGAYVKSTKKLGAYFMADDAVIFVMSGDGTKYEIYTGAQAKKWANYGASTGNVVLFTTVNGMKTVKAAYVVGASNDDTMPSDSGSTKYGFVTSKPEQIKKGDDKYWSYTIWTEDGSVDVLENATTTNAVKGSPVKFDDLGGGEVENVLSFDGDAVAIGGLLGDNMTVYKQDGSAHAITEKADDTVILYVNTKDDAGVEGGELDTATEAEDGGLILNAWVVAKTGADANVAKVIIYDVNNDLDGTSFDATAGRTVAAATFASTYSGWTISTDRTKACDGEVVTVTVTNDGTGSETTIATSVSGGSTPSIDNVTATANTAASYDIEIPVSTGAITGITVTLS